MGYGHMMTYIHQTFVRITVRDSRATHGTERVHRVLAAQSPKTRLAEGVLARLRGEGLVEDVEADGTDQVVADLVQLRLCVHNHL